MTTGLDQLGRRNRIKARPTGKRVSLTERDWIWLKALHRHGPLPTSFLLEFVKSLQMNEKRAKERLCDLFHEDRTPHGGAYLIRPVQQFQTIDSRYNQLVYDLAPAATQALEAQKVWSGAAGAQGGPWWHKLMISCVTASIELATMQRSDLQFIPQARILDRAQARLECAVECVDPNSGRLVKKVLKPDAVFGLEYQSSGRSRFRFFVVEADRATEPLTASDFNRKSAVKQGILYQAYIGAGVYREHLKLTSPLLVLNVASDPKRMRKLLELSNLRFGSQAHQLFQCWPAFSTPVKPPSPNRELLEKVWGRPGRDPIRIDLV